MAGLIIVETPSLGGKTIVAIATAIVPQQGSVGIVRLGIVRLSGSQSVPIAQALFHGPQAPWESHRIFYGFIRDPRSQEVVDEALLLVMKAPRSYTREDGLSSILAVGVSGVVVKRRLLPKTPEAS